MAASIGARIKMSNRSMHPASICFSQQLRHFSLPVPDLGKRDFLVKPFPTKKLEKTEASAENP